MKTDCCMASEM